MGLLQASEGMWSFWRDLNSVNKTALESLYVYSATKDEEGQKMLFIAFFEVTAKRETLCTTEDISKKKTHLIFRAVEGIFFLQNCNDI